jgi:two-component system sensor histidine kinase KdpD
MPNELLWVYVDALVFEKLLTNLLENAAKYSEAGSHISVSAGCFGNAIEIRVTDEGCGLPPGDTDAVFRKFHRGKHRNAVPGIGLGLSICRAIVALHEGDITAHRRPTAGTEFVLSFRLYRGHRPRRAISKLLVRPARGDLKVAAWQCRVVHAGAGFGSHDTEAIRRV